MKKVSTKTSILILLAILLIIAICGVALYLSNNRNTSAASISENALDTAAAADESNTGTANSTTEVPPIAVVNYSTTKATNRAVTVTITSNQELKSLNGWTLSTDKKRLTKVYSSNSAENVTIESIDGAKNTVTVSVANIQN